MEKKGAKSKVVEEFLIDHNLIKLYLFHMILLFMMVEVVIMNMHRQFDIDGFDRKHCLKKLDRTRCPNCMWQRHHDIRQNFERNLTKASCLQVFT
jgi:hypothetical protein